MKSFVMLTIVAVLTLPASAAVDAGQLFTDRCSKCHGTDGKANTDIGRKAEIADFTSAGFKSRHSDADNKDIITYGSPDNAKMKAYKDKLSPEEIDALVAYIRNLK
ncbi:mono/diheme cytochrome c family protein [Rhizomicrobium palustre]|uniref:Mono/diheme cytochrome c family protein n=1 Tax=Rhizomicrobium palustre TaxID=189966 RepID=A0A846MYQ1_9PROT|nr:cytochrome c [Rhizomicrobium palustre]NIK88758.1 mono/diheme cytochrome c family protein [Rhizomicrobium palustre]